jgi:hypothetical protein
MIKNVLPFMEYLFETGFKSYIMASGTDVEDVRNEAFVLDTGIFLTTGFTELKILKKEKPKRVSRQDP